MGTQLSPNVQMISKDGFTLIYDSVTGKNLKLNKDSMVIVELIKEGYSLDQIKEEYDVPKIESLFEALQERFLLIDGEYDFQKAQKQMIRDNFEDGSYVQHLRLNITEKCNLDCSYCYERESNVYGKKRTMSWDIAKKSIDEFIATTTKHEHKNISIRFFGGEPLIDWDLVEKSLEYSKSIVPDDIELNYILNTNGTLITDHIAEVLSEYGVAIALSLDGTKEFHDVNRKYIDGRGSFDIIDKNIDVLAKYRCQFNLSVVCTDANYPHLKGLIDYLVEKQESLNYRMNVNFNNVQICSRSGIASMDPEKKVDYLVDTIKYAQEKGIYTYGGLTHFVFDKLAKGYVGTHCGGVGSELSVDPQGDVFPCSGIDMKLGSINNFNDLFTSQPYHQLIDRRAGNIENCSGCEIEGFCAGGCFAEFLSSSGKDAETYRDCDLQKLTFKELVKEYVLS